MDPAALQTGDGVPHVVGQDQEAFGQAGDQDQRHGHRDLLDHRAEAAADRHEAGEGDDRGQRRGEDGARHAPGGALRGLGRA